MDIDPKLYDFCINDRDREVLDAVKEHGSCVEADLALGYKPTASSARLNRIRKRAAAAGHAPESSNMKGGAPVGYLVKRHSARFDKEGNPAGGWLISVPEKEAALKALRECLEEMRADIKPALPIAPPAIVNADLCNLFTFTDYHLGMLAWHREGGQDWDLAIAESTLRAAMAAMVAQSPNAHTAVINIQGDFLHTDGLAPVTPGHGHVLDADSRFPKIRKAAIRLIRELCAMALAAHNEVHLIIAEGNHDQDSTGWLTDSFDVLYEQEPRLTVNDSNLPFYVFEWGETMLGVHHGHKVKNESLPLLFAAQYAEAWGRTKKREIHCGHRHHRDEKEYSGATVVQHPTLASRDAYAARGGWISDRAAQAITYHKKFGQVGRVMVCPEMLERAA